MQKPARQQGLNDQFHPTTEAPPEDPTTRFTVTDQLGSPRVILDSAGDVVSRRDFLPFGEEIAIYKKERDSIAQLIEDDCDTLKRAVAATPINI